MARPVIPIAAVVVLVAAALLALESWARGFAPGDPEGVAGRMNNVVSTAWVAMAAAALALLPLSWFRWVLLAVAVVALLVTAAFRLEIL